MTRRRSLLVTQRDAALRPRLQALNAEHPLWGDRRLWASLRDVEQVRVHKTRVLRLWQAHRLVVTATQRLQAKRTPTGRQPTPTQPHAWWGIDRTTVLVEGCGWVSSVLVLDG